MLDLLQHVEREGFAGAPRVMGFDDQGREVLSYLEGEVGRSAGFIPDQGGRFDICLPYYVWRDDVLVHLVAAGSEWEVELVRRGVLDEGMLEIAWVEEHAAALMES